jgi:hypothetical protein
MIKSPALIVSWSVGVEERNQPLKPFPTLLECKMEEVELPD